MYWRLVDVVLVPKGPSFLDVEDYKLILVTPVLSKIFEKIMAGS